MDVEEWLIRTQSGYGELKAVDRSAVADFTLVWTVFEAQALHSRGSANAICRYIDSNRNVFRNSADCERFLAHFRKRYVTDGVLNHRFASLLLRQNDRPQLVEEVLLGSEVQPEEVAKALLIIALRYRNNLFHGLKWAMEMRDQRENFKNATAMLMYALDRVRQ